VRTGCSLVGEWTERVAGEKELKMWKTLYICFSFSTSVFKGYRSILYDIYNKVDA
jgi:hypothetical protein